MDFPKAPKKQVKGSLKLYVKSSKVEVEVSEEPEEHKEDLAGDLTFSPPAGFFVDDTVYPVLFRQREAALQRLQELKDKLDRCGSCRSKYDETGVNLAVQSIERAVKFFLASDLQKLISISVRQKSTPGKIELFFSNDDETVSVDFGKEGENRSLTEEEIKNLEGLLKCLM